LPKFNSNKIMPASDYVLEAIEDEKMLDELTKYLN
jgi:hypothetical protein